MQLKRKVDARLARLGIKNNQVYRALGITKQSWASMKSAKNPSLRTLKRLALVLAVDAFWLLISPFDNQVYEAPIPDDLGYLDQLAKQEKWFKDQAINPEEIPTWSAFQETLHGKRCTTS